VDATAGGNVEKVHSNAVLGTRSWYAVDGAQPTAGLNVYSPVLIQRPEPATGGSITSGSSVLG
jgi:hypothetical protein